MRNIMIHGYDVVLPEVLWDVAVRDLPLLSEQIGQILENERREAQSEETI